MTETSGNSDPRTIRNNDDLRHWGQWLDENLQGKTIRVETIPNAASKRSMQPQPALPQRIDGFFTVTGTRSASRRAEGGGTQSALELYDVENKVILTLFTGYGIKVVNAGQLHILRPTVHNTVVITVIM